MIFDQQVYPAEYADGRRRFLARAGRAGFTIESFVHPEHRGPDGEELACDTARRGPAERNAVRSTGPVVQPYLASWPRQLGDELSDSVQTTGPKHELTMREVVCRLAAHLGSRVAQW